MKQLLTITSIILSIIFSTQFAVSQQRYAVNPYGDIIPLAKGTSALNAIREFQKGKPGKEKISSFECTPTHAYGNIPSSFSDGTISGTSLRIRDMIGIWFEVPVAGTIDSLFIYPVPDTNTIHAEHLVASIHRSNISSGHAPGWDPYIAPPNVCWGYYNNTHGGAAAFREETIDTNWQSTYNNNNRTYSGGSLITDHLGQIADTTIPSFPPCAEEIWGFGGVEFPIRPGIPSAIDLNTLPPRPAVTKGEPIFVTFENPIPITIDPPPDTGSIVNIGGIMPSGALLQTDISSRRSHHNWKFYDLPSFCGPGWVAKGKVDLLIWYVMTATGDVPPTIVYADTLGHTLRATTPRDVVADIEDCNFTPSGPVGVAHADLVYSINGGPDVRAGLSLLGGSTYRGTLPGIACPGVTSYRIEATDVDSNVSHSVTFTYRTLCLGTKIALADTGATAGSGGIGTDPGRNDIQPGSFFQPVPESPGYHASDDGTAGPFAITPGYNFCGDTMHYAWIGVNGGIALTKTTTDTQHVYAHRNFRTFDFPFFQSRNGNALLDGIPKNFIAGLWTDLILADSIYRYGHIYWKNEPGRFVIEYDSLGHIGGNGTILNDQSVFRIVLNKKDRSIEYQYDNIGTTGAAASALIGMQADSTDQNEFHGYILLNKNGSPAETTPHNGQTIKFIMYYPFPMTDGWSTISVPGNSLTGDTSCLYLYGQPFAFSFSGTYQQVTTLSTGYGYWIKSTDTHMVGIPVSPIDSLDIVLHSKWNIIGTISVPVSISNVTTTPPSGVLPASPIFYRYNSGYHAITTLLPGYGYWVKATNIGAGILHIRSPHATQKIEPENAVDPTRMNSLTLIADGSQTLYLGDESLIKNTDNYELPPVPPAGSFDARFSSQSMVESYSAILEKGKQYQYRIELQSSAYPVTVQWNIENQPEGRTFVISDAIGGKVLPNTVMDGKGSVRIANASVNKLIVKLVEGIANLPKAFALGQNYPNPFNPTTTFMVAMPKTADVNVSIYNILGQKVATLLIGMQPAGYHTVEWNGTNGAGLTVPSGTYFVRMVSGEFRGVQKILMMK